MARRPAWNRHRLSDGKPITPRPSSRPITTTPATSPESSRPNASPGFTEPTFISADMWRGIDDGAPRRAEIRRTYAPVTEVGFIVEEMCGVRIGYSPDGLVGDDGD